ncbi:MAG: protein TolQ [Pseudomonadota bacterium]
MSLETEMSLISLVANASWVVKLVLLLLVAASFVSWWMIIAKYMTLKRERELADEFERAFWSGGELTTLHQDVSKLGDQASSMEQVFSAGFREFLKLTRQPGLSPQAVLDSSRRAMRAAYQREMDALESHLPFLATVGSVSPYVGLFGTVWGIMNAFRGLANVSQATLAHVAPGIAEALIATAIGLFAAIPAVVAYNRFTHDIDRLANRFDVFMEEFSNILHRQTLKA